MNTKINFIDYDEEHLLLQEIECFKNVLAKILDVQEDLNKIYSSHRGTATIKNLIERDLMILRDKLAKVRGE